MGDLVVFLEQNVRPQDGPIDATENFWGTIDRAQIASRVTDGADNARYVTAEFCPVLDDVGGNVVPCTN